MHFRRFLLLSLPTALLGLAAVGTPAQAGDWSFSFGGYGSGFHYGIGYHDYGRHYRSGYRHHRGYRHYPVYRAPRHYVHVDRYWYPAPAYRVYSTPVVVRDYGYGSRRYDREVRYYDERPTPRRGYDRVGYGDRYERADDRYAYDYDEVETHPDRNYGPIQDDPERGDLPGRIERH